MLKMNKVIANVMATLHKVKCEVSSGNRDSKYLINITEITILATAITTLPKIPKRAEELFNSVSSELYIILSAVLRLVILKLPRYLTLR